jgi:hypothetical protein
MSIALALRDEHAHVPSATLVVPIVAASAAFGASIGSYIGGAQVVYAAAKMPLFFLGTLAVCMSLLAAVAAPRMGARAAIDVAVRTIFTTTMCLGALAPPLLLAGLSMPKPRAYGSMVLLLTAAIALAGTVSVVRLRRALPSTPLWLAWIVIYGAVGAQMAWLLKPWIGYTMTADRFLPLRENLQGNFYESVWGLLVNLMR